MYRGMRVLAVVPARGGSKGIPLKNIHPVAGRPLIAHVSEVVREVSEIDRVVTSTDHEDIAAVAREVGLEAPFRRPEYLCGDRVSDLQVLQHALETMETLEESIFDVVVMLQPTSPLRRSAHVRAVISRLVDESRDAVWTVSSTDLKYHPLKQLAIDAAGRMHYFDARGASIIARQQLAPVYHRNGAAYAFTRACLLEQQSIMGHNSAAVVLDEPMVSIDTLDDIVMVERLMAERTEGISS